jgi:hypothetical protein
MIIYFIESNKFLEIQEILKEYLDKLLIKKVD